MATLPIQHIPFTSHVSADHLQHWHKLASIYHSDPQRFINISNSVINSYEGSPQSDHDSATSNLSGPNTSVSQQLDTTNTDLYKHILENCSCGECYNIFEKPDRIPWRLDTTKYSTDSEYPRKRIYHHYVNAKHGKQAIFIDCKCAIKISRDSYDQPPPMRGYIYNNYKTVAISQENKHKCEQLDKRSDILSATKERAELENLNIKHRATLDAAKTTAEITKTNTDVTAKLIDKIEKLEKQKEASDRTINNYRFTIEQKRIPSALANKISRAENITAPDIEEYLSMADKYNTWNTQNQLPDQEKPLLSYFNTLAKRARIQNNIDRENKKLEQLSRFSDNLNTSTTTTSCNSPDYKRLRYLEGSSRSTY